MTDKLENMSLAAVDIEYYLAERVSLSVDGANELKAMTDSENEKARAKGSAATNRFLRERISCVFEYRDEDEVRSIVESA